MATSLAGQNAYADLITGIVTDAPVLYFVLLNAACGYETTGAQLDEAGQRFPLTPGDGFWEDTGNGLRTYTGPATLTVEDGETYGSIMGYAIVDTQTPSAGNVLFYGEFSPVTLQGPMILSVIDLTIEVPV